MLKVAWVFLKYFLIGLGFLLSPIIGMFYLVCAIRAFQGNQYALRQWYVVDVAIATMVYGTHWRTISGLTGERAHKTDSLYWKRQAQFIDWLASLVGDGPNHCYRTYMWEKSSIDGVD